MLRAVHQDPRARYRRHPGGHLGPRPRTPRHRERSGRPALYDDYRLGTVDPEARAITPVTVGAVHHDPDPFGSGWWVRLCRDLAEGVKPSAIGAPLPLAGVLLRAPVLNPGKVIAPPQSCEGALHGL